MAVAIVALSIVAFFGTGIAILTFQPAIFDLAFENQFWAEANEVDTDIRIMRDTLYNASLAVPMLMFGVIALWAILQTTRREG